MICMLDLAKVESNFNSFSKFILSKLDDEITELKEDSAKTQLDEAHSRYVRQ